MTHPDFKPGLYEHYKGGQYIALHLVRHHESDELFVVYVSLTKGTINIREYASPGKDSWCDMVEQFVGQPARCDPEYETVPRFKFLREALHA